MSPAWARSGTRALWSRPAAARSTLPPVTSGGLISRRASSTRRSDRTSQQDEQWKSVYRAFLLHVHPDFFQDSPSERAVNEKSLKTFSQHLERLQQQHGGGSINLKADTSPLVFFLKQASDRGGGHEEEEDVDNNTSLNGDIDSRDEGNPSPRKFILPLESHHQMATLLHEAGIITSTSVPPLPPPSSRQQQAEQASTTHHQSNANDPDNKNNNNSWGWHNWGEDLFGGTAANRAWDEAAGGGRNNRRRPGGRSAFSSDDDTSREGRQRTTEWGAAFEGSSGDASRLGKVLATDAGRALVRERRASSRKVRRLVGELREQYGFGEFTFRCGWSKTNLCVALASLLETCHAHRGMLSVSDFGGLEVVFRNDPSVLHKGEVRLCPADVPHQWVSVLQRITPAVLSSAQESAREMRSRQEKASSVLRGARLSRGLSCSKRRYLDFLGRLCVAGADIDVVGGDETGSDVSLGDWSALQCRVEEGFSRSSKVLEDGTIQIGSDMTFGTLWQCLGRDFATSSAVTAESLKLAAAAAATADRCRQSLGLEAIGRARHAVSLSQMIVACEALVKFSERGAEEEEESDGGGGFDDNKEAVAARRRLRGHCVRVVGSRVGVCDGVTEDGEIVIPWNWAGGEGEGGGEGGGGERRSPASPFC